ncbi:MAG TPA: flagellar basal body L-ring protein FlgH [Acetobacteraceae bacterium]|nr:flagellar basal body L-ring protein FlgH [Acetobacteraceae bacterium]
MRRRDLMLVLPAFLLAGCGQLTRLSEVGQPPAMTPTANPTLDPAWRPVTMPMPNPQPAPTEPASLWRSGSRAFFKDTRASRVGDILTIIVTMNDSGTLKNATTASSNGSESMGIPNLFGLENAIPTMLSGVSSSALVNTNSTGASGGTGQIQRSEAVTLNLAGVVTQVLPNGNLVIVAHDEVRVNSELLVLTLSGVVRPEDITSENTINDDQIAEERVSYGGRGQLTDVQTPRWGQQLLNILLPF